MVICLERGADLHIAQLMPLPLTVSFSSKIQIGFTFLVPAHQGSTGKRAVKWVYVYFQQIFQPYSMLTINTNITQNTNSAAVIASIKGDNGSGCQWKLGSVTVAQGL